ncbi:hypothetical protein TSOC_006020 [Tetrabaena socialis]|uniref:Ankyrin repeat domain-containing protein n=1 Tax=Tetrabaena socialis TaxID=47790 RepID=A0A2J8A4S3_9CHLO|nr:hypothetical protein TSOC_006020 [Tetrabaena socialis]|eukprot:PNH07520.1 hypothetical protein TSOC_006020 [Tetrabaena socialis]
MELSPAADTSILATMRQCYNALNRRSRLHPSILALDLARGTPSGATPNGRPPIWPQLPPELAERVVCCLAPNEVACTARLINRAAAAQLHAHRTVRMSQPSPHHAFERRWGGPGAMRGLTLKQRRHLLRLTASGGDVANLQLAVSQAGCVLTAGVMAAAASTAQLAACEWLRQQGCPWNGSVMCAAAASGCLPFCRWLAAAGCPTDDRALAAAAGAGHAELCEWLALGCARGVSAAQAAAEGGHAALAERLLPPEWGPEPTAMEVGLLLAAVAAGCDLATLQRLHDAWAPLQQRGAAANAAGGAGAGAGAGAVPPHPTPPGPLLDSWSGLRVVTAAIGSATPDWAAKVAWLAGRGYPLQVDCWERAARRPDWLPRLAWLGARGLPPDVRAVTAAARAGQLEGLRHILDDCGVQVVPEQRGCVVAEAVRGGHLPVLRELGRRGWGLGPGEAGVGSSVQQAAMLGHGGVAAWLAEGAGQRLGAEVATAAAAGGSLEVLRWAVSRGCALGERAFAAAAEWGSEEMVEWLAARSCPMGDDGAAYVHAARNGDLAMLACLRRLRCPWAASGDTLTRAVAQGCRLPLLRWLTAEGCPVDWAAAARASQRGWRRDAELLGWLRAQRRAAAGAWLRRWLQLGGAAGWCAKVAVDAATCARRFCWQLLQAPPPPAPTSLRARVCACGSRFRMRRDEGDDTSALVAGEFSAALARQRGNADELFDHLSASQDELGQQLGRLAAGAPVGRPPRRRGPPAPPARCGVGHGGGWEGPDGHQHRERESLE